MTTKKTKNMEKAVRAVMKYLRKVQRKSFGHMSYGELRWVERLLQENSHMTWDDSDWRLGLDDWLTDRNPNDRCLEYGYMEDAYIEIVHVNYEVYEKGAFLYVVKDNRLFIKADIDVLWHHGLLSEFLLPPFRPLFRAVVDEEEDHVEITRIYE